MNMELLRQLLYVIGVGKMEKKNQNLKHFLSSDPRALTLLTIPAVILFVGFVVVPIISGINISFTNWNGYSQSYSYVGFDNYRKMVTDPQVWTAFRNTLIYGFGSTLIQTILGLAFAMLLCNKFFFRSAAMNPRRTLGFFISSLKQKSTVGSMINS